MSPSAPRTLPLAILLFALAWGGGVPSANAADFDVYILTGQSNSLGTTSSTESLPLPGSDPADAATAFFWSNVLATNSGYPPLLYGDSGGAITTLQTQQGNGTSNPTFWGPEFGFARTLPDAGATDVMIIKVSRPGGRNRLWQKSVFETNNNAAHMWGHLRDTVTAGLGQIGSGDTFQVKGLLYLQGESNFTSDAEVADDRLAELASDLKGLIESIYPGTAEEMYTVVAEIAASQSTVDRQTTTLRQQALGEASPTVAFVGTRDLPLKGDGIHFGGHEKLEIGHRYADAFSSQGWVEDPDLLAGYSADFGSLTAIPHPIAQGLTEGGNSAGVTMEGRDEGGTAAWRIFDNSASSNPELRQALVPNDFQAMFDEGWVFRARVKVASGGGLALWSLSSGNDPGWALAAPRQMNGFELERVNGDEISVTLWNHQNPFLLGPGSADDFHLLELRGEAGSSLFDFYIDGQLEMSGLDVRDGSGVVGFDDVLVINSGSTVGVGREVYWNEVSLRAVPEPGIAGMLSLGSVVCLWLGRRIQPAHGDRAADG